MRNIKLLLSLLAVTACLGSAASCMEKKDEEKKLYSDEEILNQLMENLEKYVVGYLVGDQKAELLKHSINFVIRLYESENLLSDLKEIIKKDGVDGLYYVGRCGWTPLSTAVLLGCKESVLYILSFPKLKNAMLNICEQTPLAIALQNGHLEIAKILVCNGALVPLTLLSKGWHPYYTKPNKETLEKFEEWYKYEYLMPSSKLGNELIKRKDLGQYADVVFDFEN